MSCWASVGDLEKNCVATEKGLQFLEDYRELQKYPRIVESKKRALETILAVKAKANLRLRVL